MWICTSKQRLRMLLHLRSPPYIVVLQRVAVCCRALLCVAVRCSVFLHLRSALYVAVCCSVLQCNAVCCSVLQCVAASA